jgi:hypothetical protein
MDQSVMVFGGSAARSSAIGTANFEEGMVSYLTDTDKVEAYNGTDWVSVAPTTSQGLTLINTTSFSGVSSISVNDVFSSTYENYKVFVNWTGTADDFFLIRYRVSGTDNTSANYFSNDFSMLSNGTTLTGTNSNGTTSGKFGYQGASVETSNLEATIFSPQISTKTTGWITTAIRWGGAVSSWRPCGGSLSVTTSYTGFTLLPGTGNITGTIRVFGVAN